MEGSFKVRNYPLIAAYVLGNLWVLHLLLWGDAPDLSWAKDLSRIVPSAVAATIFAVAISELVDGELKARLVFRKWTDPLPGTRAFSELGPRDPRVDMQVLAQRFGDPLPTAPSAQNRLWYRILKLNESRPSVAYAHQHYLLMRDLTFLTLLLIPVAALGALAAGATWDVWLTVAALLMGELLLMMRAAESLALDLVRNALAEESAKS